MKKQLNRVVMLVAPALLVGAAVACGPTTYFCDDFGDDGCRDRQAATRIYRPQVPADRADSWRSLADFMYFHSRETPGIRHEFAAALPAERRRRLKRELECGYVLRTRDGSVRGELEGRRVDEDGGGIWCFEYLGAMLKQAHKQAGSLEQKPTPDFFPVELELWFRVSPETEPVRRKAQVSVAW